MNKNNVVYGVAFGLLNFSGIIFGMELDSPKQDNKINYFSLCVKKNGPCVIKKCTIDDAKATTIMVRESELIHNLVKTTPIQYEKIKKVEDINFSILGPLLDKREKFFIEVQAADKNKEKYLIDQVTVNSWPMQFDEIKNGKYGSISKHLTLDSVVYDLQSAESAQLPVLNCSSRDPEPYDYYPCTETLSSMALIALVFYYWQKSPMLFTDIANSLR